MQRQRELSPRCKPKDLDHYQERRQDCVRYAGNCGYSEYSMMFVIASLSAGCQNFYGKGIDPRRPSLKSADDRVRVAGADAVSSAAS